MIFYLGTHMPHWMKRLDIPLFVSHRRLARQKSVPVALGPWALDSGGFTELSMFGEWRTATRDYVTAVERYQNEVGQLQWAAPQDWMCEPFIVEKTGLTVAEHQRRTVENYVELSQTGLPFIPVLQGWDRDDYLRCVDLYSKAGVDLEALATVGVGSVCRRQNSDEIGAIFSSLKGLRLHGFGVKSGGLGRYGHQLASADSMAWSARGRRVRPCPHSGVTSCNNCMSHALEWRGRRLAELNR